MSGITTRSKSKSQSVFTGTRLSVSVPARTRSPSTPCASKRSANFSPDDEERGRSRSRTKMISSEHNLASPVNIVSQSSAGNHIDECSSIATDDFTSHISDSQPVPEGRSSGDSTPTANKPRALTPSYQTQRPQSVTDDPESMEISNSNPEEDNYIASNSQPTAYFPGIGLIRRTSNAANKFLKDSDRDSAPFATILRFFKDLGNEIADEVQKSNSYSLFTNEPEGFPSFKKDLSKIVLQLNDILQDKPIGLNMLDMPFSRDSLSPTPPPAQASLNSIALAVARLNKQFDDLEKKTASSFDWSNSSYASAHNPANITPSAPFASTFDPIGPALGSTRGPTRASSRIHSRTSSPDAPTRVSSRVPSRAHSPPPQTYRTTSLAVAQQQAINSCPYPPQTGWADGTRSYANAARQNASKKPAPKNTNKQQGSGPATKPKFDNLRLVAHIKNLDCARDPAKRLPEASLTNIINNSIVSKCATGSPKLIATKWNATGNLILMFPSSANPATVHLCYDAIRTALKVDNSTLITNDVPWSKIMLTHVPTFKASGSVPSDEDITASFLNSNEWASSLIITQKPRWLIKPTFLTKEHSSVVLSFQDPDGSVSRDFLKKTILLNGVVVRSKRWIDKPILKECNKCLALNHDAASCKRKSHCDNCGGAHETTNHRLSCQQCKREKLADAQPCPHKLKCVNCHGEHRASDPSCPKRADYRKPWFLTRGGDQIQPSETADEAMAEQ